MFFVEHKVDIPFCYYDKDKNKIVINLITSTNKVKGIKIFYEDPYNLKNIDGKYIWIHKSSPMSKKIFSAIKEQWTVELELPIYKRLKYSFLFELNDGSKKYFSENGFRDFSEDELNKFHNHFFFPYIHNSDSLSVPKWASKTIWYQIFPERFCNANKNISPKNIADWENDLPEVDNFFGGDILGIKNKLTYLKELGINGIYLTPIFESPSNHKYDTVDYYKVDSCFGDLKILKELVKDAHSLNIKVMFDAVFNHIGSNHVFWQDVLKNQENSQYKDFFHIKNFPVRETYEDKNNMDYEVFAFSETMPKWNTENESVKNYLIDVAKYWITECDIDGWRLDVANEVSFDFWHDFKKEITKIKKDFYIVGEVWHNADPWINRKYFDSVMNYKLTTLILDCFINKSLEIDDFSNDLLNLFMNRTQLHNQVSFNLLDSHDTSRVLTQAKGNKQNLKNAFTFLFLLSGSPCIYYGTEVGLDGDHDPLCRKPMIWDESKQDKTLLKFFKELISFRKTYIDIISNGNFFHKKVDNIDLFEINSEFGSIKAFFNNSTQTLNLPATEGKKIVLTTSEVPESFSQNSFIIYV